MQAHSAFDPSGPPPGASLRSTHSNARHAGAFRLRPKWPAARRKLAQHALERTACRRIPPSAAKQNSRPAQTQQFGRVEVENGSSVSGCEGLGDVVDKM